MIDKTLLAVGISVLAMLTGCDPGSAPDAKAPSAEEADAKVADAGTGETAPVPEDPDGRIRITLNADGTVHKVEGRITPPEGSPAGSPVGDWQGPLKEQETDPESAGEKLATIEVYSFLSNPSDEAHSHGGGSDITAIPHCHEWIYVGTKKRLVHC